ncbi:hypothetical protein VNO77_18367 [Canavalia gladiata]|uniref:Uncharacterized protein n=1 Tax=Canavalia gladiata TaxID=3824 RepID=A0AAN9LKK5_CANGL
MENNYRANIAGKLDLIQQSEILDNHNHNKASNLTLLGPYQHIISLHHFNRSVMHNRRHLEIKIIQQECRMITVEIVGFKEESDSEIKSNDVPGSQKPAKQKHGKFQLGVSKDSVLTWCPFVFLQLECNPADVMFYQEKLVAYLVQLGKGCLGSELTTLMKKMIGKIIIKVQNQCLMLMMMKLHKVTTLALTEDAQSSGFAQVSQTMYKGSKAAKEWVLTSSRIEHGRHKDYKSSSERGKIYGKKARVETVGNHLLHDGGEACSGTGEGLNFSFKEKVDIVINGKPEQFSLNSQRKRSKKLFFGGFIGLAPKHERRGERSAAV